MIITNKVSPDLTNEVEADAIVMVLPNELCGDVGEPLKPQLECMVRGMAAGGYWPLSFGEGDDSHTTLHFVKGANGVDVHRQAEWFIRQEGAT